MGSSPSKNRSWHGTSAKAGSEYQQISLGELDAAGTAGGYDHELENQIKYAGYIAKQEAAIQRASRLQDKPIPESFDYDRAINLSLEARQKLHRIRPRTVGQASRISGVTPADITMLLLYLEKPELLAGPDHTAP